MGHGEKSDAVQIAFEFVSRLFDCKQSYSEFAQRLLMFLTDQVDKSHAGFYFNSADSYHRRWSYGGLSLSDKLPVTVSAETVEMWKAANSCGKSFVPGELIQEEPAFVQSPPSYLFVHQIPDFGDCDQWLVMAVPGDISEAAIARMTIITSLLESLSDERVTGYSDLIEMFSGLLGENHKALPIGEALKLCFKLFDGKLRMKSMRQIDADNSVTVCEKVSDEQLKVERSKIAKISDSGRKVIASREPAYCEGPIQPPFDKNNESWSRSVSHVLFPIPISDGGTALLEVEFSGNIERARNYHNLFELVSKYLGICISLTKGGEAGLKMVGTPNNEIAETMSLARLQTLSKLNGGYFHELIEHLSVILGQAEIMEYSLKKNNKPLTAENLIQSTDRIVRAAESLARRLEKLKEVSTIRPIESGQSISAELFIKMLPAMTFGYYLTVKDNRNVEIELQTKSDKNLPFSIPVLHIYDFILPLILSLMDEAVCSGKIFVSIAEHFGRPVIRISYPKKLSGKLSLEKLVDKTFNYYQSQRGEKGEFLITAGDAQFIFSACEGDRYQVFSS